MIKNILIFLTLFIFTVHSNAQQWKRYRYETIIGLGGTNFLGELGGANRIGTHFMRDLEVSMTRPLVDLAFRFQINQNLSTKLAFAYGILSGDDKTTKETYRNYRNLSFRSSIFEMSYQLEYWPVKEKFKFQAQKHKLRYFVRRNRRKIYRTLNRVKNFQAFRYTKDKTFPYFFAGVNAFYFNPKAKYEGKWYALQPLGTEGQGIIPTREKYKLFQVSIPFGVGFKYPVSKRFMLGMEYGIRRTFTDYIDDVSTTYVDPKILTKGSPVIVAELADRSDMTHPNWTAANQQRGQSRYDDSYMFFQISLIFKIKTSMRGIPTF